MECIKCTKEIPNESIFCLHCGIKQEKKPKEHKPKIRGNGTGSVYKLPSGKYRVAVTFGYKENGKRIYRTKSGFKTKKEALAYIPTLQEKTEITKNIKLFKLYEEWSNQHFKNISKSKIAAYKTAYDNCKTLHYRNIAELKLKDFQEVIDLRSGGYYPKHDMKVLFNLMFKFAIQNDYVTKSYISFIKLPPLAKSKKDAFSKEEIKLLWDDYNSGNEFTGYILIMIYTGMRYGEISALEKKNIFLDKCYMIGGIKTEAGIDRQIVIAEKIKLVIAKLYLKCETKLLEIPEKRFYKLFYEALERSGTRKLNPHCCRHTFATLMAESGIQPAIIKDIAGHEDYETTLQYTHISLDEKLKAVNSI